MMILLSTYKGNPEFGSEKTSARFFVQVFEAIVSKFFMGI